MSLSEIQEFFATYPPQKEIQLNQSAKILDSTMFIETCLLRVNSWRGDVNQCPSFWLLKELHEVCKADMIKKEAF